MSTPRTKPGKHGTLYLYEYTYRDTSDHGNQHTARAWRYSSEHLEDSFYESGDADGWELVSARRVPETGILARVPVRRFARVQA